MVGAIRFWRFCSEELPAFAAGQLLRQAAKKKPEKARSRGIPAPDFFGEKSGPTEKYV
jgi:hypothetical protein